MTEVGRLRSRTNSSGRLGRSPGHGGDPPSRICRHSLSGFWPRESRVRLDFVSGVSCSGLRKPIPCPQDTWGVGAGKKNIEQPHPCINKTARVDHPDRRNEQRLAHPPTHSSRKTIRDAKNAQERMQKKKSACSVRSRKTIRDANGANDGWGHGLKLIPTAFFLRG